MNFEEFFEKLLEFYEIKSVTDLADKLNVVRSTVSGWKNRKALSPILEHLLLNNIDALSYILCNQKNKLKEMGSSINPILLSKVEKRASEYGLKLDEYLSHLIIRDLEK